MWRHVSGLSLLLVAGCASAPVAPSNPQDVVYQQLDRAANHIAHTLDQLAAARERHAPEAHAYAIPHTGPLARTVTLRWAGALEPAVRALSALIGFESRTTGTPPPDPVLVSIDAARVPAFSVLESMGAQVGGHVGLIVNERHKLIEIVYEPTEVRGGQS